MKHSNQVVKRVSFSARRFAGNSFPKRRLCFIVVAFFCTVGCTSASATSIYTDEVYGFSFEYPRYWRPVQLSENYLRLQRGQTGMVEAEIRFFSVKQPPEQAVLVFLTEFLQSLSNDMEFREDKVIIIRQPDIAIHHHGYTAAAAQIQTDVWLEFPIGKDGKRILRRDLIDVLAVKNKGLVVVIYIFRYPDANEQYTEEQEAIVNSFTFAP
ncbi:MAG: hypothetical protein H6650_13800 [Ardenticatenales bacterium]|nr:hypothetical protein [Ardenticatenales bacterium]